MPGCAMIYEGANGVQALDLAGAQAGARRGAGGRTVPGAGRGGLRYAPTRAVRFIALPLARGGARGARGGPLSARPRPRADPDALGAGSYAFMHLIGTLALGWMWLRMAQIAAGRESDPFCAAKLETAPLLCRALAARMRRADPQDRGRLRGR